ncbi:UTP--glucose-1-phosphate uridylyltransferase [Bacillus taeanensis]|uniref:UTP--glucose-1-phosphate uridylyltransferase n=1 Tax=Bacillus taeanensis TaxID=273032 RepID=A0A366XWN9_9BACI|nr:UTP--glucose-1-phosphate uridylyltransferase [Bacillus taeanensis]RBW69968.1 UTP--glucose-1-phosphate uridylyltransferase [Bacillus taeanensis]
MKRVKKAVIPAAGYGTRSLPITKVLPKEMFPIAGKPAIHYIVEEAVASGIEEVLIVVSRNKNMILDYFDRSLELEAFLTEKNKLHLIEKTKIPSIHIQFVRQPYAKGLGDAIWLAERFVGKEPFAVLLPDDILLSQKEPALQQLINVYENTQGHVLGLKQVEYEKLQNYGVINGSKIKDDEYNINDIIEKPKEFPPSNLAVIGRYILNPSIFSAFKHISPGVGGEMQLTDAIKHLLKDESVFGKELLVDRYDIGNSKDYLKIINKMSE